MAFVDFLEPSPQRLPPATSAAGGPGDSLAARYQYRAEPCQKESSHGRFDLRKLMAAKGGDRRGGGGDGDLASRPADTPSGSPRPSFFQRRLSLSSKPPLNLPSLAKRGIGSPFMTPDTSSPASPRSPSFAASPKPPPAPSAPGASPASPASPAWPGLSGSPASPASPAWPASPASPILAQPRKLPDVKVQSTFERGFGGAGSGSFGTGSSSRADTSSSSEDVLGASAPEDLANDAALGAFVAFTTAAAKTRKQRAVVEATPWSQQLLSQHATRRNRRMSSDCNVCETRPWVMALQGADTAAKREAVKSIRTALKDAPENRMRLVGSGGVRPLCQALKSSDVETVEHAAAAILFLCMSKDSAREVISNGGVRVLVDVVAAENSPTEAARSNAAAALFKLSQNEENRRMVRSLGALTPLMNLLNNAKTARAKKDACLALFNLGSLPGAAEDMISLGVVEKLVELLEEAEDSVEEKAAALAGVLSLSPAGLAALMENQDIVFCLVDTLEGGSIAAGEHASVALHHMARKDPSIVPKIMSEGCLPPLVRLASQSKKGSDSRRLLEMLRAYCKKKAKEEHEARQEKMRREAQARQPSRLSNAHSSGSSRRRASLNIDRESFFRAWSRDSRQAVL